MGLAHSGDEYCARGDAILKGSEGILKIVDDIFIYAKTKEEFLFRVKKLFKRCDEYNFTLSAEKFQCGREVKFAGFFVGVNSKEPNRPTLVLRSMHSIRKFCSKSRSKDGTLTRSNENKKRKGRREKSHL